MVQAFIGSGGKTSTIHRRAAAFRAEGKRVFVTTTTHMARETDTIVGDDPTPILRALRESGYAMAGQAAPPKENPNSPTGATGFSTGEAEIVEKIEKIGPLSDAVYRAVCAEADVVLVEADGSRRMPLKYPAAHEPVIPENADEIVLCVGLSALGRPAREVCQRLELAEQAFEQLRLRPEFAELALGPDTIITPRHIEAILREGYLRPLRARYPDLPLTVLPCQCDGDPYKLAVAEQLAALSC
jgi:xanthine dehydrogenase accessory factor